MSRKFSIVRTIDIGKIIEEIDNYIMITGELTPYVFMSEDTIKAIEKEFSTTYKDTTYKGKKTTFAGYRVFINDDLRFGIVEIR